MTVREELAGGPERPATSDATSSRPRLSYIPALDGIRGLAVSAVLLFHLNRLTGGYLGVDAFFVLSGFLITSLLVAEWGRTGSVSLRRFWIRRVRRLLPALVLVLVAVAAYAAFVATAAERDQIVEDGLATVFYVQNWHTVADAGEVSTELVLSPLAHIWSLSIEEQFYLAWPLLVLGVLFRARKAALPTLFAVSAGLAVVSAVLMAVLYRSAADQVRVYFGTDTRAASILAGATLAVLLAVAGPVRSRAGRLALEIAAAVAVVAVGVAWVRLSGTSSGLYQGGFAALGLAVAVVIAAAAHPRPGPVAAVLSWAPLRWLGIISYGLYLWHWPVYVYLIETRVHLGGLPLDGLRVVVTVAIAALSYRFVEQPIRRGSRSRASIAA